MSVIDAERGAVVRETRARGGIRAQAICTALGGAGAFIVASVLIVASTAVDGRWRSVFSVIASPYLFGWLIAVAGLAWVTRHRSARAFALSAIVAAPAVTLVVEFVTSGGAFGNLFLPVLIFSGVGLTCAAVIGAVSGVVYRGGEPIHPKLETSPHLVWPDASQVMNPQTGRLMSAIPSRPTFRSSRRLAALAIFLAVFGGALALALPVQWADVYFAIWSAPPPATAADEARFAWTAGGSLALLAAAIVVAILRGAKGLIWLTVGTAICALMIAIIFHVQQPRHNSPEPLTGVVDTNPPCYGTSGYCPGG